MAYFGVLLMNEVFQKEREAMWEVGLFYSSTINEGRILFSRGVFFITKPGSSLFQKRRIKLQVVFLSEHLKVIP